MSRINLVLDEAELSNILLPHIRASFPGLKNDAPIKVIGSVTVDFDLGLSLELVNRIIESEESLSAKDDLNQIFELSDAGMDVKEIGEKLKIDWKKVRGQLAGRASNKTRKEKTSISKDEFDKALIEIDASVKKQFEDGTDIKTVILSVTKSYPALRKGAIAERIEKAHRIWLQDHPATSEPVGLEKELDTRIMEFYPKHSTKEISDMLDEEGFIVTPKEIMQRVKTFQLREIAKGAGKSIDPQLPDRGRSWKDDDDLKLLVEKDEEPDTSDFGSQGMELDGVTND